MPKTRGAHGNNASMLPDLSSKLSEEGKLIVQLITDHIDILKSEFTEKIKEKDKEIAIVKSELNSVWTRLAQLEERHDDAEAYERRNTLIISGDGVPEASQGENCTAIVSNMIREKLRMNISAGDIFVSHRIGQKPRSAQHVDRRNIIVKLCRRNLKDELLSMCRFLRPNIYLNESLTPTRSTILSALRKVKRMLPDKISGCKSESGRVYVFLKNESDESHRRNKKILVNTRLKLEDMCRTVFNVSVNDLVSSWPQ